MAAVLQRAIDNFEQVEPILKKIDFDEARTFWEEWATKEHSRLLKKNKSLFKRVPSIKELLEEKMQGQSLLFAAGIAKILDDIQEAQTVHYVNLVITKKDGQISVRDRI